MEHILIQMLIKTTKITQNQNKIKKMKKIGRKEIIRKMKNIARKMERQDKKCLIKKKIEMTKEKKKYKEENQLNQIPMERVVL